MGIINKPLLLHLVGSLYYCIRDARSYKQQIYFVIVELDIIVHTQLLGTFIIYIQTSFHISTNN